LKDLHAAAWPRDREKPLSGCLNFPVQGRIRDARRVIGSRMLASQAALRMSLSQGPIDPVVVERLSVSEDG
jgi:hypothetical protein